MSFVLRFCTRYTDPKLPFWIDFRTSKSTTETRWRGRVSGVETAGPNLLMMACVCGCCRTGVLQQTTHIERRGEILTHTHTQTHTHAHTHTHTDTHAHTHTHTHTHTLCPRQPSVHPLHHPHHIPLQWDSVYAVEGLSTPSQTSVLCVCVCACLCLCLCLCLCSCLGVCVPVSVRMLFRAVCCISDDARCGSRVLRIRDVTFFCRAHTHTYTYIHTHTHTYTHIHTYIHTHTYTYIYIWSIRTYIESEKG